MTYYPTTLLPPSPLQEIDQVIMNLWSVHLELELQHSPDQNSVQQHLEVTAAIIDYWEEVSIGINKNEIRKRRLNCDKNDRG